MVAVSCGVCARVVVSCGVCAGVVASYLAGVLGTEPGSPARAVLSLITSEPPVQPSLYLSVTQTQISHHNQSEKKVRQHTKVDTNTTVRLCQACPRMEQPQPNFINSSASANFA